MTDPRYARSLNALRASLGLRAAVMVYVTEEGRIGYADAGASDVDPEWLAHAAGNRPSTSPENCEKAVGWMGGFVVFWTGCAGPADAVPPPERGHSFVAPNLGFVRCYTIEGCQLLTEAAI
jgi:hypothetical protein